MLKSLWASVQGDPVFMRKFNGWLTIVWLFVLPLSIVTGLVNSVGFISLISIYALVTGHLSAWQAARVEVKQDQGDLENKVDEIHQEVKTAE
jgi:hypothetical protein